jgi:hypothetical protein
MRPGRRGAPSGDAGNGKSERHDGTPDEFDDDDSIGRARERENPDFYLGVSTYADDAPHERSASFDKHRMRKIEHGIV